MTGVDSTILLHVVKQWKFLTVSNYILCSLRFHENGKRGFGDIMNGENEINIGLVMISVTGVQGVMK